MLAGIPTENANISALLRNTFQEVASLREACRTIECIAAELGESKCCSCELEALRAKQLVVERSLLETQQEYQSIITNVQEVIFQTDTDGLWTFLNPAWEDITGFSVEESIGRNFAAYVHAADRASSQELFALLVNGEKERCRYEVRYWNKKDGYRWGEVWAVVRLEGGRVVGTLGTLRDISERKKLETELNQHRDQLEELVKERTDALHKINEQLQQEIAERQRSEERLRYLATHDKLTNTPNRYYLEEELGKLIAQADESNSSALLFMDIDNFKVVNDTYGHTFGDQLIVGVTQLFQGELSETDLLARLSGDQFAVVLHHADLDKADKFAEKFRRIMDEGELCINTQKVCLNLTVSIGVVIIDGMLDVQELLSYADTALYAAKEEGKNRILIIESAKDKDRLSETNKMVAQIKAALKEHRFQLHFQPVYNLEAGIAHYEALIRLRAEEGNLLYPNSFIPVAERVGLMSQIDRWVVTTVLAMLKKNQDAPKLFVNLSGMSLGDKALLSFIEAGIRESGIAAERIGFEITETTAVKDLAQAERWIIRLKALGCSFALDDFGVGFSSFSYLSTLPVDYLKIDGSFVREVATNPKQLALVQAMNAVAHTLGKKTIAEFVENETIVNLLKEIGVDCGQGYYFGKPAPLSP